MGTFNNLLLNNVRGQVGGLIYTSWKGIPVVKSAPKKRTGIASELQLKQQARFRLMGKFLRPLSVFINQVHRSAKFKMTGFNKMMSENTRYAITGEYPQLSIDYSKIILSKGNLPMAHNPSPSSIAAGKIECTWIADSGGYDRTLGMDEVFVAVYSETIDRWILDSNVTTRSSGSWVVDAVLFSGTSVHVYIGFVAADHKKVTDSLYLGTVRVL